MKRIAVCMRSLVAMLNIAPKEGQDIRFYLCGVYVEPVGDGAIRYVATDYNMVAIREVGKSVDQQGFDSPDGIHPLTIPHSVIEKFKLNKKSSVATLTIQDAETVLDGERKVALPRNCMLEYQGLALAFTEVPGEFPKYRSVIPIQFSGEVVQFDPLLLVKIERAARTIIGCKVSDRQSLPILAHNGSAAATGFCVTAAELYGGIMPIKADTFGYPVWLQREAVEDVIRRNEKWLDRHKGAESLEYLRVQHQAELDAARAILARLS